MASKLKSMLRKQVSFAVRSRDGDPGWRSAEEQETTAGEQQPTAAQRTSLTTATTASPRLKNAKSLDLEEVTLRKKTTRRRHRTSLGVLENVLKCPICKDILRSPRMLPCQHTFCLQCIISKLQNNPIGKENVLRCPVCKSETGSSKTADNLPANLSIENVLRAVDGSFIEARPQSLHVNFAPLGIEQQPVRCSKCDTSSEAVQLCRHCNKVFCQVCQENHIEQLKEQVKKIIDQLQETNNKLDHRVIEFQQKTENLKNMITKEFDAKIAGLMEEKQKKLSSVDELREKGENSAEKLKQRILDSRSKLTERSHEFDNIDDDKEKIDTFLEIHRKATEMISWATSWQTKFEDMIDTKNQEIGKIHEKENPKSTQLRPRIICDRKEVQRPSGLSVDPRRGDIYVCCPGNAQILVIDRQYRLIRRIQNPNLMAPQGIAYVDSLQEIFVTDKWKHTIYAFTRQGQMVRKFGGKGKAEGELRCPEGITALKSRSWLYVADTGNDRIQIFGVDGSYKGGIGSLEKCDSNDKLQSLVPHKFNQPTDVAVSNTAIVVADCGNHKIKVFNHKCQLMFSIGAFGAFKGFFKSPEVVEIDHNGNIIVGDSDNGRVQMFSSTGSYVRSYGVQGTLVGHFGWISGLLVLPTNEILVADSKRNMLELV